MSQLAENIYVEMIAKTYTDLSKAEEEDLKQLATSALQAAKVLEDAIRAHRKSARGQTQSL